MALRVRNPRDLGAAMVFVLIGLAGLWFGRGYTIGSAARMGPGYLPAMLSGLLVLFGLIIAVRSLSLNGPPVEIPNWRPIVVVLAAIGMFSLLIQRVGFAPTVLVTAILGAWATAEVKPLESIVLGVALTAFCVVVFIYGLRQPIPVFGVW